MIRKSLRILLLFLLLLGSIYEVARFFRTGGELYFDIGVLLTLLYTLVLEFM